MPRIAATFDADSLTLRDRETLRGVARYAQAAGWELVLDPFALHHGGARHDGLLVLTHKCLGKHLVRAAAPVVCLAWSQRDLSFPQVLEDRFSAGRLAARHLVERGYRSFAYVGFQRSQGSWAERDRFRRALGRLGRPVEAARTFVSFARRPAWREKVTASLGTWLSHFELPLGIFVARPGFARAVADIALARSLRIPEDVGIIAADDDPVVCEMPPALTALSFDYAEVGYRAAALLDRLLHGEPKPARAVLIQPTLIPRRSTDRLAVADPLVADALWFIDDRRTEGIRPRDVAAAFGVTERTLQRRFRKAGRDTVQHEIANARVEHAKLGLDELRRRGSPLPGAPPVEVTFVGPPAERDGEGWRQWAEDPRRRAALVERLPDGTERIRRRPLPMPTEPLARPGRAELPAIARESGFPSYGALLRAFKRKTASTPIAWTRHRT
ncbi:MAG: hypothetical protein FJ291_00795 [Planctomycetes bacterium]|nr:hypothetical protein [Planctomycetota bacterium]